MKSLKFDFDVFCEPKETWFLLPMIMIGLDDYNCFSLCCGFLCFGLVIEIRKK